MELYSANINAGNFSVDFSGDNAEFNNGYYAGINAINFSVNFSSNNAEFKNTYNGEYGSITADNLAFSVTGILIMALSF